MNSSFIARLVVPLVVAVLGVPACDAPKSAPPKPGDSATFASQDLVVYFPDGDRGMRRVKTFAEVPDIKRPVAFAIDPKLEVDPQGVWISDGENVVFIAQADYDARRAAFEAALIVGQDIEFVATQWAGVLEDRRNEVELSLSEPAANDSGLDRTMCYVLDKETFCVPKQGAFEEPGVLVEFSEGLKWMRASSVVHQGDLSTFKFVDGDFELSRRTLGLTRRCLKQTDEFIGLSRFDSDKYVKTSQIFAPGARLRLEGYGSVKGYPKFIVEHHIPALGEKFSRGTMFTSAKAFQWVPVKASKGPQGTTYDLGEGRKLLFVDPGAMASFMKTRGSRGVNVDIPMWNYVDEKNASNVAVQTLPKKTIMKLARAGRVIEAFDHAICPSSPTEMPTE